MTGDEFYEAVGAGFPDTDNRDYEYLLDKRPLLAHYTSTRVLESILKNDELWFSNPLFMNDLDELRFGMNMGSYFFGQSLGVERNKHKESRITQIGNIFRHLYEEFSEKHQLDVYVFCLSEHDRLNTDGTLSMWRAYGGHGNGASLVFNTNFLSPNDDGPIFMARVAYASSSDRNEKLINLIRTWWNNIERLNPLDNLLYHATHRLFEAIKVFSLTHKHIGFLEEREWRAIYFAQRDDKELLKPYFGYFVTNGGIEPKLKFPIKPIIKEKEALPDWSFHSILEHIILGPSISSKLAYSSVARMLDLVGKPNFKAKLIASTIPLRPLS